MTVQFVYQGDPNTRRLTVDMGTDISEATSRVVKYRKPDYTTGQWSATQNADSNEALDVDILTAYLDVTGLWQMYPQVVLPTATVRGLIFNLVVLGEWDKLHLYTTRGEMAEIASQIAINLRQMDPVDDTTNTDILLTQVMEDATTEVNMYLLDRYYQRNDQLAANEWVRRQTSLLACHLLSLRRFNESKLGRQVEELRATLTRIRAGAFAVPGLQTDSPQTYIPMIDRSFPTPQRMLQYSDWPYYYPF